MKSLELEDLNGICRKFRGFMEMAKRNFKSWKGPKCNFTKTGSVNTASSRPALPSSILRMGDSRGMVGGFIKLGLGHYGQPLAKKQPRG